MASTKERYDTVTYTGPERMYLIVRRMWAPVLAMGAMIVLGALIIGAWNASANVADHFANAKAVRDAAAPGSELLAQLGRSEAIKAWLPGFKFFGMGLILAGITMVVATIIGTLRESGARVQSAVGASRVLALRKPLTGYVFPVLMAFGLMVLMGTLAVSIYLGVQVGEYFAAAKATRETAQPFLAQFGEINAIGAWVEPLKFVGVVTLLTGIGLALATIVRVLRFQTYRTEELAGVVPAGAEGRSARPKRAKSTVAATRGNGESLYRPGQAAPVSGVYVCDLDRQVVHLKHGKTIPPCPGGSDHHYRLVPDQKRSRSRAS